MIITYHNGKQFELVEQHSENIWFAYPLHNAQRIFENIFDKGSCNKKLQYKEAILTQVTNDYTRTDKQG
jgi:hypothetical protein